LIKLAHSIGREGAKQTVALANNAGEARTWSRLRDYVEKNEDEIKHKLKHSPTKWVHFVDRVYATGAPFGFGTEDVIVGGPVFPDIIDPLDALIGAR
jgi:hypothetical protein